MHGHELSHSEPLNWLSWANTTDWIVHVLQAAPFTGLRGDEIFKDINARHFDLFGDRVFPSDPHVDIAESALTGGIALACRRGDVVAAARRPGTFELQKVPAEEWAYLEIEMYNCGRPYDEPCRGNFMAHGECRVHRQLFDRPIFLLPRRVRDSIWPSYPSNRLVLSTNKEMVCWESTMYSLPAASVPVEASRPVKSPGPPPNKREEIEAALRQRIAAGIYDRDKLLAGKEISQEAIAEQFGCTRTPVREALDLIRRT